MELILCFVLSLSRFGRGFTVKVHVKNTKASMEALTRFMQLHFPKTYLKVSKRLSCLFILTGYDSPIS